jgi:hypothetical protein
MDPVYTIDADRKFVSLYWDEFPTLTQLREVVECAVANSEFEAGMNFIWDRKPGTPNNANVEYLREAVYYLQLLADRVGNHAWALVTHNASDFGKARMIEAMTDQGKVTVRAFQSRGDAEEWLRHPVRFEPEIVHFPARSESAMHPRFA